MIKKILLLSATLAACMAIFAGPASAQDGMYPPVPPPTATISDTTIVAGQSVTIEGFCYADVDSVEISIEDGASLGTIAVGDDDSFSGSVTIPASAAPGEYVLLLTCGDEVLSRPITVLAAGSGGGSGGTGGTGGGTGTGALARTGTEVDGLVKLGGGLLVAGAAAVLFATKRRSATV